MIPTAPTDLQFPPDATLDQAVEIVIAQLQEGLGAFNDEPSATHMLPAGRNLVSG
jgi:hypothetical protein